jgi:hypothetical protein
MAGNLAEGHLFGEFESVGARELTREEDSFLKNKGIGEFVFSQLTSRKFRKSSLDESAISRIKAAISSRVSQNLPVRLVWPFGCYKLWRLPSSPEPDWAEFFSLIHVSRMVSGVLAEYEPGVEFVFSSDDCILERIDNIPVESTAAYREGFEELLGIFGRKNPKNFFLKLVSVADFYSRAEFEEELQGNFERVSLESKSWDSEKIGERTRVARLNVQLKGKEDLTLLNEKEFDEEVLRSSILEEAYRSLSKRRGFLKSPENVLLSSTTSPGYLAIGSCKSSVAKFWCGYGVLEEKTSNGNALFEDRVLSPEQLNSLGDSGKQVLETNLPAFRSFKNLRSITVVPAR